MRALALPQRIPAATVVMEPWSILPMWTTSKINGSLQFNGSNYVTVSNITGLSPANLTVSTWIYPTSLSGTNVVMGSSPDSGVGWNFNVYNGGMDIVKDPSNYMNWNNYSLTLNTWHHLVFTYDGSNGHMYVDGESMEIPADPADL